MTDRDLKAAAYGIMVYQTYINSGKLPSLSKTEATVSMTPFCFEALYKTMRFCAARSIENASFTVGKEMTGDELR